MSDKRCGTLSPHGPHPWGDLNWCPGAVDTPDATASEPLIGRVLRSLADDADRMREANLTVGWDDGPEQAAWLLALAATFNATKTVGAYHYRGAPGCRLSVAHVTESPNCWCPRDNHEGDATASEPLSEGLTEAEQSWGIPYSGRHIFMEQDVERIVAAREAAAATRAHAEGAAAERERIAAAIEAERDEVKPRTHLAFANRMGYSAAARIARSQS